MNFRGKHDYLSERRLQASLATNSCRTNFAIHWGKQKSKLRLMVKGLAADYREKVEEGQDRCVTDHPGKTCCT